MTEAVVICVDDVEAELSSVPELEISRHLELCLSLPSPVDDVVKAPARLRRWSSFHEESTIMRLH
jgi:hypothetical protein